jgi:citrate/tricarballylate utilization protein
LFHRIPPYAITSFPVLFGSIGGVAMIVGAGGLILIKSKSDSTPADSGAQKLDYSFLIILGLASLSGLLTLILRTTSAMGILLAAHLGLVGALFITAPYGKFIHALYRSLALISHRVSLQRASQTSSKIVAAGSDRTANPSAGK